MSSELGPNGKESDFREIKIREIQRAVEEYFRVHHDDLLAKRRDHHLIVPRQVAMYLAMHLTKSLLPEIGRMFNRHHTTLIHAERSITRRMQEDASLRIIVDEIRLRVTSKKAVA